MFALNNSTIAALLGEGLVQLLPVVHIRQELVEHGLRLGRERGLIAGHKRLGE